MWAIFYVPVRHQASREASTGMKALCATRIDYSDKKTEEGAEFVARSNRSTWFPVSLPCIRHKWMRYFGCSLRVILASNTEFYLPWLIFRQHSVILRPWLVHDFHSFWEPIGVKMSVGVFYSLLLWTSSRKCAPTNAIPSTKVIHENDNWKLRRDNMGQFVSQLRHLKIFSNAALREGRTARGEDWIFLLARDEYRFPTAVKRMGPCPNSETIRKSCLIPYTATVL